MEQLPAARLTSRIRVWGRVWVFSDKRARLDFGYDYRYDYRYDSGPRLGARIRVGIRFGIVGVLVIRVILFAMQQCCATWS